MGPTHPSSLQRQLHTSETPPVDGPTNEEPVPEQMTWAVAAALTGHHWEVAVYDSSAGIVVVVPQVAIDALEPETEAAERDVGGSEEHDALRVRHRSAGVEAAGEPEL